MLPNEEFALACRAYYEEQGLIVDKTNGEFAHCPLPRSMGETGYYLLWEHHQHQGLLQSRDVGRRCYFTSDVKKWLLTADYFPDNFFELWDIFEEIEKTSFDPKHLEKMRACRTTKSFARTGEKHSKRMKKELSILSTQEKRMRTRAANNATSKRIEITFPNGLIGIYPSTALAATFLGTDQPRVAGWARKNRKPSGRFKNYSARYL